MEILRFWKKETLKLKLHNAVITDKLIVEIMEIVKDTDKTLYTLQELKNCNDREKFLRLAKRIKENEDNIKKSFKTV